MHTFLLQSRTRCLRNIVQVVLHSTDPSRIMMIIYAALKLRMPMDMFYFLAGRIHNNRGSDVFTLSFAHYHYLIVVALPQNIKIHFLKSAVPHIPDKNILPYNHSFFRVIPLFKNGEREYSSYAV